MGLTLKTVPKSVQTAQGRFTGMKNVDVKYGATVDYGTPTEPITVVTVDAKTANYNTKLNAYNQLKKDLDVGQNEIKLLEKELVSIGNRILSVGKGKFGFDSPEVETLGGKRSSERKAATKKVVKPTNDEAKKED